VFKKSGALFLEQKTAFFERFIGAFGSLKFVQQNRCFFEHPRTHFGKNIFSYGGSAFVWPTLPARVDLISDHENEGCFRQSEKTPRIGQEGI